MLSAELKCSHVLALLTALNLCTGSMHRSPADAPFSEGGMPPSVAQPGALPQLICGVPTQPLKCMVLDSVTLWEGGGLMLDLIQVQEA